MFRILYGLPNCSTFKFEWVPVAHHLLLACESSNWAQILSMNLKEETKKYQKTPTTRKMTFYMFGYVMDAFYATSLFSAMGWNWNNISPSVHISCLGMWEDNFIPQIMKFVTSWNPSLNMDKWPAKGGGFP